MIPHPKLPAYGKQLLRERRGGRHPSAVTIVYGELWSAHDAECRLAVKPDDALGRDWRCVAGLPIHFVNRSTFPIFRKTFGLADGEPLRLLGEIALESAQIVIEEDGVRCFADDLAFLRRHYDASAKRMIWPAWWSEETNKIHGRNRQRWLKEAEAYLARLAA